jgi:hypothetical protein
MKQRVISFKFYFLSEIPEDTLSPDNFGPFGDDNDEYLKELL